MWTPPEGTGQKKQVSKIGIEEHDNAQTYV